jgi:hypothetical protein
MVFLRLVLHHAPPRLRCTRRPSSVQHLDRMPASFFLQTKGGGAAKGVTLREFRFKAKHLITRLEKALTTKGRYRNKRLRVIYDSAKWHPSTAEGLGLKRALLHLLPSNSPDMNKVVEHLHARIKQKFKCLWAANPNFTTRQQGVSLLRRILKDPEMYSGVEKDFLTMRQTYAAVVKAKGGWPAAKFR